MTVTIDPKWLLLCVLLLVYATSRWQYWRRDVVADVVDAALPDAPDTEPAPDAETETPADGG